MPKAKTKTKHLDAPKRRMTTRNRQGEDKDPEANPHKISDTDEEDSTLGNELKKKKKKTSAMADTVKEFSSIISTLVQSMQSQSNSHAAELEKMAANQAQMVQQQSENIQTQSELLQKQAAIVQKSIEKSKEASQTISEKEKELSAQSAQFHPLAHLVGEGPHVRGTHKSADPGNG